MFDMTATVSLSSSKVLNELVSKRDENWVKLADDSIEQQKLIMMIPPHQLRNFCTIPTIFKE